MKREKSALRRMVGELTGQGTRKFEIGKELIALSEKQPARLYLYVDSLIDLLESENNIIKWTAFRIVANLAAVDRRGRIPEIIDRYLAVIKGPELITATTAIAGAARIAGARKELSQKIVRSILQVRNGRYKTEECRNIAIGHAITALAGMEREIRESKKVIDFVANERENPRAGTRKKAERFLRAVNGNL